MGATIGQILRWCTRLTHKENPYGVSDLYGTDDFRWSMDFLGYAGAPPVGAMLSGTKYLGTDPDWKAAYPNTMHWTRGCHSTAVLIQTVLRAVNLPVFVVHDSNPRWSSLLPAGKVAGDHAACYFRSCDLVLAHGDNPYDLASNSPDILPFPPEALAISGRDFLPFAGMSRQLYCDVVAWPLALVTAQFLTKARVLQHYKDRKGGLPAGAATPAFDMPGLGVEMPWWKAQRYGVDATARLDALVDPYLADPNATRLIADLAAIPKWSLQDVPE
jgi:hypothetical protein